LFPAIYVLGNKSGEQFFYLIEILTLVSRCKALFVGINDARCVSLKKMLTYTYKDVY